MIMPMNSVALKYLKRVAFICSLLLIGLSGCDRSIDSRSPVRSLPGKPPTPLNITVQFNSNSVVLSWQIGSGAAVARYRIYRSDSTGNMFVLIDSTLTKVETKTISGLSPNQLYLFTVAAVGSSGIEGDRSLPIRVRPGIMSILINNGADFTSSTTVQLRLTAPVGAVQVLLSEDSAGLDSAPVESFATQKNISLSDGDGLKTVFARFIFADGSKSGSPLSDQITLDTRSIIDSVYFTPITAQYIPGDVITFFVLSVNAETGGKASVGLSAATTIDLFDDGQNGDAASGDGLYSSRYIVPNNLTIDDKPVIGSFTDEAGNRAPERTATNRITILSSPNPSPVILAAVSTTDSTVDLSWSQFDGGDFANYRLYRDSLPPATVDSLDLNTAQSIKIINSRTVDSFSDFLTSPGTFYYQIFVNDIFGRSAPSNIVAVTR